LRLLPSGAARRAQQSAVICREGWRAIRVGCRAQGGKGRDSGEGVDEGTLSRVALRAFTSRHPAKVQ